MIVYNLPPIIGLGSGSGFEFQLLSLGGGAGGHRRGDARPRLRRQPDPGAEPGLLDLRRQHAALYLDIDREKVQTLGIEITDVFNALSRSSEAPTSTISTCSAGPGR